MEVGEGEERGRKEWIINYLCLCLSLSNSPKSQIASFCVN